MQVTQRSHSLVIDQPLLWYIHKGTTNGLIYGPQLCKGFIGMVDFVIGHNQQSKMGLRRSQCLLTLYYQIRSTLKQFHSF